MKNFIKLLNTRVFAVFVVILLPTAILALTWSQILSKPYISPGDPGCATLDAYLATSPANKKIKIYDTQTLTTNRTVPATCTLEVARPGYVVVPTGAVFTIAGTIDAGQYKIFECQGTGYVTFSSTSSQEYWTRWWGTAGDNLTDDTIPLSAAFTCLGRVGNKSAILNFSPGDIHITDPIVWAPTSCNFGTGHTIRFNGATLKQKGSTGDVLQLAADMNQIVSIEGPGTVRGFADHIWYKTGIGGAPTAVTFNASAGTERSTLVEAVAEKNWFYSAADGGTLYVYVACGSVALFPNNAYAVQGIQIDGGAALTGWSRYFSGNGIYSTMMNVNINQITGIGLDNIIHLAGAEVGSVSNIIGIYCNSIIKGTTPGVNKPTAFGLYGIRGVYTFGDIISIDSGDSFHLDGLYIDYAYGRIMNIANVEAFSMRDVVLEVTGVGGVVTEGFLFTACKGIDISGSSLLIGQCPDEDISVISRIMYFASSCGGISIHGNQIEAGAHMVGAGSPFIYGHDGTLSGIIFTGNSLAGRFCEHPNSAVTLGANSYLSTAGQCLQVPISSVLRTQMPNRGNYATVDPSFTGNFNATEIADCTSAQDDTVGYKGPSSYKMTMTGASPDLLFNAFLTYPASGTYYGVLSFVYRADTAMNISALVDNYTGSQGGVVPVSADGDWCRYFFKGDAKDFADVGKPNRFEMYSDSAIGNLWIDDVQMFWFGSDAEANAFMGKYATADSD